jgi:hypothetical protein
MARLERDEHGVWTLHLEEGDEGRNADHDEAAPRYLTALDPVVERARERSEFEFIYTLLRVRGLQAAGWDAYETTLHAIAAMRKLHDDIAAIDENFETARHLQLWTYGHILEASEPYEILANLLDIVNGGRFLAWCFPADDRGRPQSVGRKIELLEAPAGAVGEEQALTPLREIYDRQLRNAVFHADYTLHGGEVRLPVEGVTYSHEEVMRLINRALAYHDALSLLFRRAVSSYEAPAAIPVHPGFSADPDERATVIVREGHGVVGLKHSLTAGEIAAGGIPWRVGIFTPDEAAALDADPELALLPARADN